MAVWGQFAPVFMHGDFNRLQFSARSSKLRRQPKGVSPLDPLVKFSMFAYNQVPRSEQSSDCEDEKNPMDSSRGEGRETPSARGPISI